MPLRQFRALAGCRFRETQPWWCHHQPPCSWPGASMMQPPSMVDAASSTARDNSKVRACRAQFPAGNGRVRKVIMVPPSCMEWQPARMKSGSRPCPRGRWHCRRQNGEMATAAGQFEGGQVAPCKVPPAVAGATGAPVCAVGGVFAGCSGSARRNWLPSPIRLPYRVSASHHTNCDKITVGCAGASCRPACVRRPRRPRRRRSGRAPPAPARPAAPAMAAPHPTTSRTAKCCSIPLRSVSVRS